VLVLDRVTLVLAHSFLSVAIFFRLRPRQLMSDLFQHGQEKLETETTLEKIEFRGCDMLNTSELNKK